MFPLPAAEQIHEELKKLTGQKTVPYVYINGALVGVGACPLLGPGLGALGCHNPLSTPHYCGSGSVAAASASSQLAPGLERTAARQGTETKAQLWWSCTAAHPS